MINEEYQFRKELFLALDSYIKNAGPKVIQAFKKPDGNGKVVPGTSASPPMNPSANDNRPSLYVLADLFITLIKVPLKYLFHMPLMPYGSARQPVTRKNEPEETNIVAHMTPRQRKTHAAKNFALSIPRFTSYPVSGALGIISNGIWEISPNNIAISDALSRSISSVLSGLL